MVLPASSATMTWTETATKKASGLSDGTEASEPSTNNSDAVKDAPYVPQSDEGIQCDLQDVDRRLGKHRLYPKCDFELELTRQKDPGMVVWHLLLDRPDLQ